MNIKILSYVPGQGNEGSNPSAKLNSAQKKKGGIIMVKTSLFLDINIMLTMILSLSLTGNALV